MFLTSFGDQRKIDKLLICSIILGRWQLIGSGAGFLFPIEGFSDGVRGSGG